MKYAEKINRKIHFSFSINVYHRNIVSKLENEFNRKKTKKTHIPKKWTFMVVKTKKFFLQYFVLRTNMSNEIKTNRFFCRKLNSFVLFVCVCVSRIFILFSFFSLYCIRAHRGDLQKKKFKENQTFINLSNRLPARENASKAQKTGILLSSNKKF